MSDGKYISVSEAVAFLGYNILDTNISSQVSLLIPVAEELVDDYCYTKFETDDDSVYYLSGNGTKILDLKGKVRNISSIELVNDDSAVIYELTKWKLGPGKDKDNMFLYAQLVDGNVFESGVQNYRVVGDWGYNTVPSPIKFATALLLKHLMNSRDINAFYQYENSSGRNYGKYEELNMIPQHVQKILNKYRRIPVSFPGE